MTTPEERLRDLGITLPEPPTPAAVYVPTVQSGSLLFISGQVASGADGMLASGKVGDGGVDRDTAVRCAEACAVNVIAQAKGALGDLSRVRRVVKVTVFVASQASFTEQHLVANGASELIGAVFGDAGRHARAAVGSPALPLDTPVEVEAILEVG